MVLNRLDVFMYKNTNRSTFTALHKIQLQIDQRPLKKMRYTKSDRRESGEYPGTHSLTRKKNAF